MNRKDSSNGWVLFMFLCGLLKEQMNNTKELKINGNDCFSRGTFQSRSVECDVETHGKESSPDRKKESLSFKRLPFFLGQYKN